MAACAQTLTLRFDNPNRSKNNTPANYRVDVDGKKYYSSNAKDSGNYGSRQLFVSKLPLGSHTLNVYELPDNSSAGTGTKAVPAYANTFQLRTGYDMVISIRRDGQVSFSEKKIGPPNASLPPQPMKDDAFEKLSKSITDKWSQTSRVDSVKRAFANKTYFFSTEQAGQLLLLITAESKRLELAKLSYPKVTDTSNFADVADLFKTQPYKDSIDRFIQSKKPPVAVSNTTVGSSHVPLTSQQFSQLVAKMNRQWDPSLKTAVLSDALKVSTNYFTTVQMRELLSMINPESDRLDLAMQSYPRITDVANFSSLQNLFSTQESRDEFAYFVRYGSSPGFTGQYTYRVAMSESDFKDLQLKIFLRFNQSGVVSEIKYALSNTDNYFSIDQIRSLLNKINLEADRLSMAKLAYHRVVDPIQFTQLFDLFTSQSSKDELSYYMRTNPS
jgi:YHS domain-containing protein